MGSKKLREQKKSDKVLPSPSVIAHSQNKVEASKSEQRPIYTVIFMVIGIVALAFIFTVIVNTFITDHYMSLHPELSNDTEAMVLDPGDNAERILQAVGGKELKYVLLTHSHLDLLKTKCEQLGSYMPVVSTFGLLAAHHVITKIIGE